MNAIYAALAGSAAVTAIVGDGVFRVIAPQSAKAPYVVMSGVALGPEAYLSGAPDLDNDRVQVHAWARDFDVADALARACRAALDPIGYMAGGYIENWDAETKLYRVGFDWSLWTER